MVTQQKPSPISGTAKTTVGIGSSIPPADRSPNPTVSGATAADNARTSGAGAAASASSLTARNAFRENVDIATGVVLVTASDSTVIGVSMAVIADGIIRDSTIADLPVCSVSEIIFLHPSGSREAEPVKWYAANHIGAKRLLPGPINYCKRFNPASPEGAAILIGRLKAGACIFVQVEYKDLRRDDTIAALASLETESKKIGALVVIYVLCSTKDDPAWLRGNCEVFVAVRKCEPAPDAQAAIVLINVSLAGWHPQGIGRVMVEASLDSAGVWAYRQEPFIAERAIVRLAWYLRARRVKVEQIAKIVGINRSNVSRGLDSLLISPDNTVGLIPPKGWQKRWASRYHLEDVLPRKAPIDGADTVVTGEGAKAPDSPKAFEAGHVARDAAAPERARPASLNSKP